MVLFLWRGLAWLLLLGIVGLGGVAGIFYYFGSGLPSYQQLAHYKPPIATRFYASDGRLFAEYAFEKRLYVPLQAIPPLVIKAFLAAEDKNFYSHMGIDPLSIVSAAITNISRLHESKRPIGASTITQQVARNFLLTDISTLVSLERKIKEAILALRIEQAYSKDYILELYLNQIYLGSSAYGVAAAALTYFNKHLRDLTIEEAAFLAGLPKAPSHYDPRKSPQAAKARRDYVIKRMAEEGVITAAQAHESYQTPLVIKKRDPGQVVKADFFAEEVRREILDKYGEKALYQEGFAVRTTLDPGLQAIAEKALRQGLMRYDRKHGWRGPLAHIQGSLEDWKKLLKTVPSPAGKDPWTMAIVLNVDKSKAHLGLESMQEGILPFEEMKWARAYHSADDVGAPPKQPADVLKQGDVILVEALEGKKDTYALRQIPKVSGALLCIDPHKGSVLAMQGGFSFQLSQYNRATQARRQPGSAFKSFVYLAALEKGLTPSTIIDDAPFSLNLGSGLGVWRPHNYDGKFKGPITLRRAFELSRNLVTVRITHQKVGIKRVMETAKRFGILDSVSYQPSMVLGALETTLLRMVKAHAILINGGKDVIPTFIERVQDRHGKAVLARQDMTCEENLSDSTFPPFLHEKRKEITDKITAYQMVSLFEGVVARGTGRALSLLQRPVGGKSGTTNDFKDAWFIGCTPTLVVGVYVGFDQPSYLGKDESGGRLAAPIVKEFMEEALRPIPTTPFPVPAGIKLVRVNVNTGRIVSVTEKGPVILEAFRAGTEEEAFAAMPVDELQDMLAEPGAESSPTPGAATVDSQPVLRLPDAVSPPSVTEGLY